MDNALTSYIPIIMMFLVASGIGIAIIALSHLLSPRYESPSKSITYESGFIPLGNARGKFHVRFCVVAILFIIFDVEAVFIFPWALIYKKAIIDFSPTLIIGEMFLFVFILFFGLVYAWKRGGLDWE